MDAVELAAKVQDFCVRARVLARDMARVPGLPRLFLDLERAAWAALRETAPDPTPLFDPDAQEGE